jgi:hypothetical protein
LNPGRQLKKSSLRFEKKNQSIPLSGKVTGSIPVVSSKKSSLYFEK